MLLIKFFLIDFKEFLIHITKSKKSKINNNNYLVYFLN